MKALVFEILQNSLYSIRIPYTWQSQLTYPILPPSSIIGMVANALQRYKNDLFPVSYLEIIQENTFCAMSRLIGPCIIKSYTTSNVVKWEDSIGGKFTNALGRQFAYTKSMQVAIIFKNYPLSGGLTLDLLIQALKSTPLTCGDSESPITVYGETLIKDVKEVLDKKIVSTEFPVPFSKGTKILDGNGQVFLMHERCKANDNNLPLVSYLVPVRNDKGFYYNSFLKIEINFEKVYEIDGIGFIIVKN